MQNIRVEPGNMLTLTGDGVVSCGSLFWTVHPDSPLRIHTPGVYNIGDGVTATLTNSAAEVLAATLPRATAIISTAANIVKGIRTMALGDKMKHLADRVATVPKAIEAKADDLLSRLDTLESRGAKAMDDFSEYVAGVESGVAATEDALNQLSNGAPAA